MPRQIANAHVAFNVLGVAAFIGFAPAIAKLLESLVPDARSDAPDAAREGEA